MTDKIEPAGHAREPGHSVCKTVGSGYVSLSSCQVAVDYGDELVHIERLGDRLSGSAS
jgi:hypothetical protein